MHAGVLRDMEQQRIRRERQLDFDMQKALEQEYKKLQTVQDTTNIDNPAPSKWAHTACQWSLKWIQTKLVLAVGRYNATVHTLYT